MRIQWSYSWENSELHKNFRNNLASTEPLYQTQSLNHSNYLNLPPPIRYYNFGKFHELLLHQALFRGPTGVVMMGMLYHYFLIIFLKMGVSLNPHQTFKPQNVKSKCLGIYIQVVLKYLIIVCINYGNSCIFVTLF